MTAQKFRRLQKYISTVLVYDIGLCRIGFSNTVAPSDLRHFVGSEVRLQASSIFFSCSKHLFRSKQISKASIKRKR